MARPSECGHESGIQADKQEDLARQTDSSIQSAKVSILCGQLIVRLWDRARASVRLSKEQSSFDRACLPALRLKWIYLAVCLRPSRGPWTNLTARLFPFPWCAFFRRAYVHVEGSTRNISLGSVNHAHGLQNARNYNCRTIFWLAECPSVNRMGDVLQPRWSWGRL